MRTYHHGSFAAATLARVKGGHTVTVCLPARDEAATVGAIVATILAELVDEVPLVDEVLVVDDRSDDATAAAAAAAGARVVAVDDVLADHGRGGGKGVAMWKGLAAAAGDLIVFCDADVVNFDAGFVTGLLGPLLTTDDIAFVKGFYQRPLDGRAGEGGRVTELVARPLLTLLFPAIAGLAQPLAGECAGRREVLERVPFVEAYGVDIGLVIDLADRFGTDALAQCDLGTRIHRNRSLAELAPQARQVMETALTRAGVPITGEIRQRPPLVQVPAYRKSA